MRPSFRYSCWRTIPRCRLRGSVLLPFSDGERSSKLESFIAAFSMGMKLKFGGALQHLQTTLHTEPDPLGGGLRRQFLVVYDAVPGGTGYLKQYISLMHGLAPERALLGTFDERIRFIVQTVAELGRQGVEGADICVTLPGNQDVDRYYKALTESGVEAYKLIKGASDNRRKKGVRLATMHRVKGLEFIAVILVDTPRRQAADETGRDDVAVRERSLRYVAATRARQYLFIVETGSR